MKKRKKCKYFFPNFTQPGGAQSIKIVVGREGKDQDAKIPTFIFLLLWLPLAGILSALTPTPNLGIVPYPK